MHSATTRVRGSRWPAARTSSSSCGPGTPHLHVGGHAHSVYTSSRTFAITGNTTGGSLLTGQCDAGR